MKLDPISRVITNRYRTTATQARKPQLAFLSWLETVFVEPIDYISRQRLSRSPANPERMPGMASAAKFPPVPRYIVVKESLA